VICGSTEDLEFDHEDASSKAWDVSNLFRRSLLLEEEVKKCRLLCHPCHWRKTVESGELRCVNKIPEEEFRHGTARMYCYRKCRCEDCIEAKQRYQRKEIAVGEIIPRLSLMDKAAAS
jgi:hypothetical protein